MVLALIPTNSKDNAEGIHKIHMLLLKMTDQLDLRVLALATDGASAELSAQEMMDQLKTEFPPMTYEHTLYGVHLRCPVFTTGPLISISDPPHGQKTSHNQPQYGTHTASMGSHYLMNRSLVDLYKMGEAGPTLKDVENVDKQDDGAAHWVFHT